MAGHFSEYLSLHSVRGQAVPEWFADGRLDMAIPSTRVLTPLVDAARESRGIEMVYSSMTTPAGRSRVIYPHAIVRLEQRWHVRAWCVEHREFRDFNVGRIQRITVLDRRSPVEPKNDELWNKVVVVRVIAHRDLTTEHQEVVRREYFNGRASKQGSQQQATAEAWPKSCKVDELLALCDQLEASLRGGRQTRGRLSLCCANPSHRAVPIARGATLADYVPFYFTPFSPMLLNIVAAPLLRIHGEFEGVIRETLEETAWGTVATHG